MRGSATLKRCALIPEVRTVITPVRVPGGSITGAAVRAAGAPGHATGRANDLFTVPHQRHPDAICQFTVDKVVREPF